MTSDVSSRLRAPTGPVDLSAMDPADTSLFKGGKKKAGKALSDLAQPLSDLQERLFAEARAPGWSSRRRILLVLQGMDTAGKGGIVRHVAGLLDPQGVQIKAFKAPTEEERAHDFLWRIKRALPEPGMVGMFDRSHYEDVLVVRVHQLAPPEEIERRYGAINDFERWLADGGTTVVKCFLHISKEKQRARLLARLDDPTKHWKFNPRDVDERAYWDDYQRAYEIALERCNTPEAPWHVIPSDHKWYRNWIVSRLLLERLEQLDLQWPKATFDVEEQRRRLLAEDTADARR
jgi:PPK2 family polyphosphate:nucleotide phosphotransferase